MAAHRCSRSSSGSPEQDHLDGRPKSEANVFSKTTSNGAVLKNSQLPYSLRKLCLLKYEACPLKELAWQAESPRAGKKINFLGTPKSSTREPSNRTKVHLKHIHAGGDIIRRSRISLQQYLKENYLSQFIPDTYYTDCVNISRVISYSEARQSIPHINWFLIGEAST